MIPFSVYRHTEKAKGIEYLYAWLDKHPYVRAVVTPRTMIPSKSLLALYINLLK
jgi:hypothetical protein